jgi:hypothetical protein
MGGPTDSRGTLGARPAGLEAFLPVSHLLAEGHRAFPVGALRLHGTTSRERFKFTTCFRYALKD